MGRRDVALNNSLEVLGHRGMMRMPEHFPGSARIIPDWAGANSRFDTQREFGLKGLIQLMFSRKKRGMSGKN
jgi:hypothetical protein